MTVYVCGGSVYYQRRVMFCPTCDRRRRMVWAWAASPYYGPTITCCACGESWQDGFRMDRPFRPRWREKSAAAATERWQDGQAGPPPRDDEGYVVVADV